MEAVLRDFRVLDHAPCMALGGSCCFYASQSGVFRESLAMVRKEKEKRCQGTDKWYQSLFSWSTWLTTLLTVMADQLIFLLLALSKGLCLLNYLLNYVKQGVNSFKSLVRRGQHNPLPQDELMISLKPLEPVGNVTGLETSAPLAPCE